MSATISEDRWSWVRGTAEARRAIRPGRIQQQLVNFVKQQATRIQ